MNDRNRSKENKDTVHQIIKKYRLTEKTWTHKSLQAVLHYFFPVGEQAIKPLNDYFGDCYDVTIFFIHDNIMDWYWHTESMDRLRKKFVEKVNKDKRYLSNFLSEWKRRIKTFEKVMKKIDVLTLSTLSNQRLLQLYHQWYKAYLEEYGIAIGIQDGFSMRAETFLILHLKRVLQEKKRKEAEKDLLILLSPVEESFITRELRDRITIAIKKSRGQKIDQDMNKHVQKYHWLQNNYAKDVCLDKDYFAKQIEEIKNPKEELMLLDEERSSIRQQKKVLLSQLDMDLETKNLIAITEVFAYMQDERKKYVLIATHYERMFIEEIGRRVGLRLKEMESTCYYKMADILSGKLTVKEVKTSVEKRKNCCVIFDRQGYDILEGKEAKELFDQLFKEEKSEVKELKGVVASPGRTRGIVKIIRKTHDIINMQQGDILVASMTRPEMVVAMKKAGAIVTDEGGVTSHAAVISRELKIPCVIGTKIATKVFKDGDLVEVDAEKGIVRMVKKISRIYQKINQRLK